MKNHPIDHNELSRRVEQERRELQNAPVVKIETGAMLRCHFCGAVTTHLYEKEILGAVDGATERSHRRMACGNCHHETRKEIWKMRGEQ